MKKFLVNSEVNNGFDELVYQAYDKDLKIENRKDDFKDFSNFMFFVGMGAGITSVIFPELRELGIPGRVISGIFTGMCEYTLVNGVCTAIQAVAKNKVTKMTKQANEIHKGLLQNGTKLSHMTEAAWGRLKDKYLEYLPNSEQSL